MDRRRILRGSALFTAFSAITNRRGIALANPFSIEDLDSPQVTAVFPAGMAGVKRYRIPGVVVTRAGTLLAYCEARRNNSSDWGEIEVHLRRSLDGGTTWESALQIAHLGNRMEGNPRKKDGGEHEQTVNNPVAMVDQSTGDVVILYCVNYARCFMIRSVDDGLTWSKPVEITDAFEPFRRHYPWTVLATGPGHGVQLDSGRLVVPVWIAYGTDGAHAPSASATIYSDDHGRTWKAGDVVFPNTDVTRNPNETMIATLHRGGVLLVNRNESTPNRKLVSTSLDGATQWSTPVFHPDLWEPICMASVVQVPHVDNTLLYSGPRSVGLDADGNEKPNSRGKRHRLSISMSSDDGSTWPIVKQLHEGPSAYSDLAVLPDGTVVCLFESGEDIDLARFTLDWVRSESER